MKLQRDFSIMMLVITMLFMTGAFTPAAADHPISMQSIPLQAGNGQSVSLSVFFPMTDDKQLDAYIPVRLFFLGSNGKILAEENKGEPVYVQNGMGYQFTVDAAKLIGPMFFEGIIVIGSEHFAGSASLQVIDTETKKTSIAVPLKNLEKAGIIIPWL